MVPRAGTKPGDWVMVTGTIGDASLGLDVLKGGVAAEALAGDIAAREMLIARYRVPQPRNALALALREHATAAMDVSDGLAGDLAKLCAASGVSATIDLPRVPLSAAAAGLIGRGVVSLPSLISGGDDYEVMCTVPDARRTEFVEAARQAGVAVAQIGAIVGGNEPPKFLDAQGTAVALQRLSYSHF
jgi:thiamine-monophosphate kinase